MSTTKVGGGNRWLDEGNDKCPVPWMGRTSVLWPEWDEGESNLDNLWWWIQTV